MESTFPAPKTHKKKIQIMIFYFLTVQHRKKSTSVSIHNLFQKLSYKPQLPLRESITRTENQGLILFYFFVF